MTDEIRFLLEQSSKCRRLAVQLQDQAAKNLLLDMANDYRRRAAELHKRSEADANDPIAEKLFPRS